MTQRVNDLMGTVADFMYVCDEGEYKANRRLIADAYSADSPWFLGWFIDTFVTDTEHKQRFLGALRAVDGFVKDFTAIHYEKTGEPLRIPPELVDELKRRIVRGYWPNVDEIVREAKHGQPLRAKMALLRTMKEESWRTRS